MGTLLKCKHVYQTTSVWLTALSLALFLFWASYAESNVNYSANTGVDVGRQNKEAGSFAHSTKSVCPMSW